MPPHIPQTSSQQLLEPPAAPARDPRPSSRIDQIHLNKVLDMRLEVGMLLQSHTKTIRKINGFQYDDQGVLTHVLTEVVSGVNKSKKTEYNLKEVSIGLRRGLFWILESNEEKED